MKAIVNVNIVLPDKVINNGVIIFDEEINNIISIEDLSSYENVDIINGEGGYVTPGFIDIHIHGAGGYDTMEGTEEALSNISNTIIKTGVTHFLPTTMTMESKAIKNALDNIINCRNKEMEGAQILGANVEGPFISPEYKGAQAEKNIKKPDMEFFNDYLEYIKIITVAPEIEGGLEFIKTARDKGIIVSAGHSGATYEDLIKARKYGLQHATHLFNAMTGLHHRKPGIVGAVLSSDMSCELIADNIHINPAVLKLVTKTKALDEIILITDSMEAAGLDEGEYSLGGQKVIVKDEAARLENGALAGSILTLNKAVINMLKASTLPLEKVINMVTLNPACLLNIADKIGSLKPGLQANISLFDSKFNVRKVFIRGKEKYSARR